MSPLKYFKFINPRAMSILKYIGKLEADNKASKRGREILHHINLIMVIPEQPNLSFSIFGKFALPQAKAHYAQLYLTLKWLTYNERRSITI